MASHVTPEYNRAYYLLHREAIKARVAEYRNKHRLRLQAEHRARYWCTRKRRLAQVSAYKKCRPAWQRSWDAARERCRNPHNRRYGYYGGRGIRFLLTREEIKWLAERDNVVAMQHPTLDRINVNGHYEFSNCQFLERAANTSKSWRDTPIRRWRGGQ